MPTHAEIVLAMERGLTFLARSQQPTGQFPVQATLHYEPGSPVVEDASPFATTHIVHALSTLPGSKVQTMLTSALAYMRREMSGAGLWRYWNRDAIWGGRKIFSFIPADLDDTACHSALMQEFAIEFPENKHLFLGNRDRRGCFYTWFVPRARRNGDRRYWQAVLSELTIPRLTLFWQATEADYNDVDAVVNANILCYLGECADTKPVIQWLVEIIQTGKEAVSDKWYRDIFTFYYAIARCQSKGIQAFTPFKQRICERLLSEFLSAAGEEKQPMHVALATSTMINLEIDTQWYQRAIEQILISQAPDGGWSSAPYYYGGPQQSVSWGSRELTTGLCLEALYRANSKEGLFQQ